MSTWVVVTAIVIVLALAAQSVRVMLSLPKKECVKRVVLLCIAGALGVAVLYPLVGGEYWAFGLALGFGVVELGPTALGLAKKLLGFGAKKVTGKE